jgi:glucokinase
MGGTDVKYGIVDSNGRVVRRSKHPTEAQLGPERVIELIAKHALELAGDDEVVTLGMGVPGPMNSREGLIYEAPNLPNWINVPVAAMLREHVKMPVFLNNDANAAAYGEFWIGAGRDVDTMILFTLGTGVGGGIILNGELFHGPDDTAGELGHMIINFNGPLCNCGNHGCLEAYASATAVKRMLNEALAQGRKTIIEAPSDGVEEFGAIEVYKAALAGDELALEIWRKVGEALGYAAATCINVLNPDMLAYGGAVAGAGEFILKPLRETALANSFKKPGEHVRIEAATLGADAGIIGAAGLALKNMREVLEP